MSNIFPRHNGKSTLTLNLIKKQAELNEVIYIERVKNDLLREENTKLKELLKYLREYIGNNFVDLETRKILLEVDGVLKND